jgi:outer membrane protein
MRRVPIPVRRAPTDDAGGESAPHRPHPRCSPGSAAAVLSLLAAAGCADAAADAARACAEGAGAHGNPTHSRMRIVPLPLLALLLGLAAAAAAQAPAAALPERLTLDAALEAARTHNPAYRRTLTELEVAAADERRAVGALLPTLSLNLSTGMSQARVVTGQDEFGRPVRLDDPAIFTRTNASQSLSLGQVTLFDGGARLRDVRASRAGSIATRAGVEAEAVRLRARLAARYFEAVRAERLIALEEQLLESARGRQAATERLLRVAARDPVDALGAELEVAQQEQALEAARGEARKARLALGEEIGLGREVAQTLADDAPPPLHPAALDADSLVRLALQDHPLVSQATARARANDHRLAAVRAERLPSLSLFANAGRSVGASGYDAFFQVNPRDQSYGFGFNLSFPVFTGFRTSFSVAQARAARSAAQEEVRARQLQVEGEVRSAVIDLENAHRRSVLAERAAELARTRLAMAEDRYLLGGTGYTELQDVADRAAAAEREALAARFDTVAARIRLEERLGRGVE